MVYLVFALFLPFFFFFSFSCLVKNEGRFKMSCTNTYYIVKKNKEKSKEKRAKKERKERRGKIKENK